MFRCSLSIHESCYMVEDVNELESQVSSASTEPWFCEPCLYGLIEPPHCELCPNRYGAFKRSGKFLTMPTLSTSFHSKTNLYSDIGGRWIHLICALYTPGITFGDVERLAAISWQELDHRIFGRKACVACTDRLEARTGVTVQCEAAMCKNFFHVTCAQR